MAEGRPAPITLDHFSEAVVAAVTRAVTSNPWRDRIIRCGGKFEVFVDVGGVPQEGLPSGGATVNR